jgi:type IV pilus assembly protein PilA
MLQSLRKRLAAQEDGFTLIELMVVVLIIAILIAIAVPTFLGARQRAADRAAQSDLRNTYTSAKVLYSDAESFTGATAANLKSAEPSLDIVAAAPTTDAKIHVVEAETTADPQAWLAVRYSSTSGNYFGWAATSGGTVDKCKASTAAAVDTVAECVALAGATHSNW